MNQSEKQEPTEQIKKLLDLADMEIFEELRKIVLDAAPRLRHYGDFDLADKLCLLTGMAIGAAMRGKK
jgi:hypothetical protein